jgi:hypothetical protein
MSGAIPKNPDMATQDIVLPAVRLPKGQRSRKFSRCAYTLSTLVTHPSALA